MDTTNIKRAGRRVFRWTLAIVVISLAAFVYVKYFFVFGEGVKSGQLNFIVRKGYVFKTYEGRMIQAGYRSPTGSTIQSNEFEFSVVDEEVAKVLELKSGKILDLHYKEYLGVLPWRGVSKFVVNEVVGERDVVSGEDPPAVF